MRRGEVYLVHVGRLAPAPGHGVESASVLIPAVIVTRDALNEHSPTVLVAPIVDGEAVPRVYPSDVPVAAPEGGLTVDSVVLTAQVRAVPRTRLSRRLGVLSDPVLRQVDRALRITFGLDS